MGSIKELPLEEKSEFEYTCKRCGAHLGRVISLTAHKFGGFHLRAPTIDVCKNCLNGNNFNY